MPFMTVRKGKERKVDLYSAYRQYSTTKRSDVDHTVLPANTPHLPFLRISIRWRATLMITVNVHPATAILLIPRPTEGRKLSWPSWLTHSVAILNQC